MRGFKKVSNGTRKILKREKMKVLVVGASGCLGRNILIQLPKEWTVTAIYRSDPLFPLFLTENKLHHVQPMKIDLASYQSRKILKDLFLKEFDVCFFAWGNSDIAKSVMDPGFDIQSNVIALNNLLCYVPMRRIVYISSGTVYEGNSGLVNESAMVQPKTPYGISKLTSELLIKSFSKNGDNELDYCIIRFFGAYGPYEPERKIYTNLVKTFGIRKEHRYTIRGDGKNLIDAMFVEDAVNAFLYIGAGEQKRSIVNVAYEQPMSINELVQRVANVFGINNLEILHEGQTAEPIKFMADTHLLHDVYGFRARVTLEEGIQKLFSHLQRQNR
jgi:nucleoside-diphosphate-sugar epimerase